MPSRDRVLGPVDGPEAGWCEPKRRPLRGRLCRAREALAASIGLHKLHEGPQAWDLKRRTIRGILERRALAFQLLDFVYAGVRTRSCASSHPRDSITSADASSLRSAPATRTASRTRRARAARRSDRRQGRSRELRGSDPSTTRVPRSCGNRRPSVPGREQERIVSWLSAGEIRIATRARTPLPRSGGVCHEFRYVPYGTCRERGRTIRSSRRNNFHDARQPAECGRASRGRVRR